MIRSGALLILLLGGVASAEMRWTPPEEILRGDGKPKQKPVAAFDEDHRGCVEWTDGCIVCKRQEAGELACSMPGIACLPAEPACVSDRPRPLK